MVNTLFKKYIINAPNLYHLPSTLSAHQVHLYPSFNTPPQPPKEEKKTIHTCMSIGILLTPSFDIYSWVYC